MIDYIKGEIAELTPATVVIDTAGIGYCIHISLPTFSVLQGRKEAKLFVYEVIREDAHLLYGFTNQAERQLFLLLISVSGVGANTARMIMSSYSAAEIQEMIATGNVTALNAIKGIGAKTAQRIIVDLKDKIMKVAGMESNEQLLFATAANPVKDEAVSALVMLGFAANASQKVIDSILKKEPTLKVEQLIKLALKML
ncbi:MAG: Holliday junction branch migration protein RuvA [Bacteroidia bacterium]|jgi:Holliday junction DNA helicase RuvA|nr:Holliday junction branch migration protein RuvA [Paludibacter sp.]MDD3489735.1 Holliday junction branch migration protein RuvA [Paludibacter sp.]NCB68423.1 Holliday junction branch migration protein RuvA [Bacteroidia bacterium]